MRAMDARKLKADDQFKLRVKAVRLRENGKSNQVVSEATGLCPTHISTIYQKYKDGGLDALRPKKRGRKFGEQRRLRSEQEREILELVINQTPKMFATQKERPRLWTRRNIQLVISERYQVDLSSRTMNNYLKRWGLSFPPLRWRPRPVLPIFHTRKAARPKQGIRRGERQAFRWDYRTVVTPKGVLEETRSQRLFMFSAVTENGKRRFMLSCQSLNKIQFQTFLSRLIGDCNALLLIRRKTFKLFDDPYFEKLSHSDHICFVEESELLSVK